MIIGNDYSGVVAVSAFFIGQVVKPKCLVYLHHVIYSIIVKYSSQLNLYHCIVLCYLTSRFDGVLATLGVALAVLVGTIGANVDVVEGVGFPLALQTEDMGGAQEYWYSAFASFQIAVQIILGGQVDLNDLISNCLFTNY